MQISLSLNTTYMCFYSTVVKHYSREQHCGGDRRNWIGKNHSTCSGECDASDFFHCTLSVSSSIYVVPPRRRILKIWDDRMHPASSCCGYVRGKASE